MDMGWLPDYNSVKKYGGAVPSLGHSMEIFSLGNFRKACMHRRLNTLKGIVWDRKSPGKVWRSHVKDGALSSNSEPK